MQMEIILLEKVEKLGKLGDIVKVKKGFARNYLLPQKKALRATLKNKKYYEDKKNELKNNNVKLKNDAENLSHTYTNVSITIIRQASDQGQLFGSVNSRDIAIGLNENRDNKISPKQVKLNQVIKTLGVYDVKVYLHPEVNIFIQVNVARTLEEASNQLDNDSNKNLENVFDKEEDFEKFKENINPDNSEVTDNSLNSTSNNDNENSEKLSTNIKKISKTDSE